MLVSLLVWLLVYLLVCLLAVWLVLMLDGMLGSLDELLVGLSIWLLGHSYFWLLVPQLLWLLLPTVLKLSPNETAESATTDCCSAQNPTSKMKIHVQRKYIYSKILKGHTPELSSAQGKIYG